MNPICVGFLELNAIAKGIQVLDALVKKAIVKILFAHTVSSGKYLIGFTGEVEDVRSASFIGREIADKCLLDSFILPNIHPEIIPALSKEISTNQLESLGILELATCATAIVAADAALKTSKVKLLKIQLAKGIGGKAYFVIEGEIADVEAAITAGCRTIQHKGIIERIVIPQARPEVLQFLK